MKYLSIVKYALLAVSVLIIILFLFLGDYDRYTGVDGSWLNLMMDWMYIMIGLTIILAVIFPIIHIVQNPKGAIQTLTGLAIVAVVVGISYALSSDTPIMTAVRTFDNPAVLKLSDTGLYTAYIALSAAILAIIVCEIRNAFK